MYLLVEQGQNHIPQNQRFRHTIGPPVKRKEKKEKKMVEREQ